LRNRLEWYGLDYLAQARDQWRTLVNTVMNLQVPENDGKFLSSSASAGLSRRIWLHGVRQYNLKFGI
jgi:hypothetical protein